MATEGRNDTVHISGKTIVVVLVLLLLLISTLGMFALKSSLHNYNSGAANAQTDNTYSDLPEKCRLPAGQDVSAWKEHLGHHAETQDCLNYFK